jgi:D-lactate dehydrogenase
VRLIALRCTGFNHVDLAAARDLSIPVVRVPSYSPHSVAEHTVALVLTLNRKIHRAYTRVREGNFSLEGLAGFDLFGKTIGLIGLGKIGRVVANIFHGFGCRILAHDLKPDPSLISQTGLRYVELPELYKDADVICLHLPLAPETLHLIDEKAIARMKRGVMVINTGRGGLIDSRALVQGLKTGQVGSAGLDVYEEEESVFSHDLSGQVLQDDILARLLTFPNVVITAHQGYFTQEALDDIARTTLQNVSDFEKDAPLVNELKQGDEIMTRGGNQ